MTTGQILKKDLGLSNFKYILIQRLFELPNKIFIITVDSRFPNIYIPYNRVKKMKSTTLQRLKIFQNGVEKGVKARPLKVSIPMSLESFDKPISSNDVVLMRDLAGEYYMNKKLYEDIKRVK